MTISLRLFFSVCVVGLFVPVVTGLQPVVHPRCVSSPPSPPPPTTTMTWQCLNVPAIGEWVAVRNQGEFPACAAPAGQGGCLWFSDETACKEGTKQTDLPSFNCGNDYLNVYGHSPFTDTANWCYLARNLLSGAGGTVTSLVTKTVQVPTRTVQPPSVLSKVSLGPINIITNVPEEGYQPDATLSSVPYAGTWRLMLPNGKNYLAEATTPYFQNVTNSQWKLVYGFVPCSDEARADTFYGSGFWIFSVMPAMNDTSILIGFGHAERGSFGLPSRQCKGAGIGDSATLKSLGVVYSRNGGLSWTEPQQIVTIEDFDANVYTKWSGIGDAGYVRMGNEFRAYFQANGGFGIARSKDPLGSPGTWEFYTSSGWIPVSRRTWTNVLPEGSRGPNPSIIWSTYFQKWVMCVWPWGSDVLLFFYSGQNAETWIPFARIAFPHKYADKPLYATMLGAGGTVSIAQDGWLYWALWDSSESARKFAYQSLRLE